MCKKSIHSVNFEILSSLKMPQYIMMKWNLWSYSTMFRAKFLAHLRFLLLPGAFSLLCFSDGKCFVTRDWNTPLKPEEKEIQWKIGEKKRFINNTKAFQIWTDTVQLTVSCWQTDEHIVCHVIHRHPVCCQRDILSPQQSHNTVILANRILNQSNHSGKHKQQRVKY